ncbi:MAG: hypothetical protein VKI42_01080 [Synechococcaceae cyanobacterium]|nr:hypothetical protein [Synechococcaceae cyanobacterium]
MEYIAKHLRRQDVLEVFYSDGMTGEEAVLDGWKTSSICRCIDGDQGQPVGICGVHRSIIWMLGTDELLATASHRRQLARGGRRWVDSLMATHPCLENWALASNRASLRWLRHLGFTIDTPAPMGPCAQLFCHFWRTA